MNPIHFVVETGSQSGGVRVIGEYANGLARMGWPVSIWSVSPKESMTEWFDLDRRVQWMNFFKTGTVQDYDDLVPPLTNQVGLKIATFWRTAYAVEQAIEDKPGTGLYLVQDIETSYASEPMLADMVMKTYEMPLRKFTTSRWVEKNMPGVDYVGLGIPPFYSPQKNEKRNRYPLACMRRQALKGWPMLLELAGYMARAGRHLRTFGHDMQVELMFPTLHNPGLNRTTATVPNDKYIRSLYREFGCFVTTSRHEGFNMTALEAMACGCPVVKTRDDGSDEYMEPEENCLIGDDAEHLCEQIMRLMADSTLRNKLSRNGIKTASRYRWEAPIQRLATLLTE